MKFYILTCNGYAVEDTCDDLGRAIERCRELEADSGDTFARVVRHNGRLVADSDGARPEYGMSAYERQESSFGESP